jgi:hypothetical protein
MKRLLDKPKSLNQNQFSQRGQVAVWQPVPFVCLEQARFETNYLKEIA